MFEDEINDSYKGVDAASAKASNIKVPTNLQKEKMNSFLIAESEAANQAQKIREMHAAKLAPVAPGQLSNHSQPDIPYLNHPCAVKGCRERSEGAYATVSPKAAFEDPATVRREPLSDEDWERYAFTNAEETKLRALGHTRDLITQIEHAQHFVGNAPVAQQFISTAILPLCAYHNEHREETLNAGWKPNALPVRFGHQ